MAKLLKTSNSGDVLMDSGLLMATMLECPQSGSLEVGITLGDHEVRFYDVEEIKRLKGVLESTLKRLEA